MFPSTYLDISATIFHFLFFLRLILNGCLLIYLIRILQKIYSRLYNVLTGLHSWNYFNILSVFLLGGTTWREYHPLALRSVNTSYVAILLNSKETSLFGYIICGLNGTQRRLRYILRSLLFNWWERPLRWPLNLFGVLKLIIQGHHLLVVNLLHQEVLLFLWQRLQLRLIGKKLCLLSSTWSSCSGLSIFNFGWCLYLDLPMFSKLREANQAFI